MGELIPPNAPHQAAPPEAAPARSSPMPLSKFT